MIEWKNVTRQAEDGADAVVSRCQRMGLAPRANWMQLLMDVQAVTLHVRIDFAAWLAADDADFAHDVGGIQNHINRDTGELEDCFVPRFAVEQ